MTQHPPRRDRHATSKRSRPLFAMAGSTIYPICRHPIARKARSYILPGLAQTSTSSSIGRRVNMHAPPAPITAGRPSSFTIMCCSSAIRDFGRMKPGTSNIATYRSKRKTATIRFYISRSAANAASAIARACRAPCCPISVCVTARSLGYRKPSGRAGGVARTSRNPHRPPNLYILNRRIRFFPVAIKKMFNNLLERTKLKLDRVGKPRTAYSLRHTYICMRLMEGADIYQIAKNCRTSVEMIEKFYAAHIKSTPDATAINIRKPSTKSRKVEDQHPERDAVARADSDHVAG
jgi:hypothetical protein